MENKSINELRNELALRAKHGLDFILAASIIWMGITYIWTLPYTAYNRSILTFILGGLMLPLAFGFSKILKTEWKMNDNDLQPLGMWLNIAQLFYFPFLIFILIKQPDYFVMTYVIITGAHFFPYAWFYNEIAYAIMAGIITMSALLMAFNVSLEQMYLIPLTLSILLLVLAGWLSLSYLRKRKSTSII